MQAQTFRPLRDGRAYDALLLAGLDRQKRAIPKAATIENTLDVVMAVSRTHRQQTAGLVDAARLRGSSLDDTLRRVWRFVYEHIQYRLDEPGFEQVRRPARLWADRQAGGDCEDYSVFISSLLLNLGIAHKFRIAAYARGWQHIYVVVPKAGLPLTRALTDRANYYVLDCVKDAYDEEETFTQFKDFPMSLQLEELSGFGALDYPETDYYTLAGTEPVVVGVITTPTGMQVLQDQYGDLYPVPLNGLGELGKFGAWIKKSVQSVAKVGAKISSLPIKLVDKIPGGSAAANALVSGASGGLVSYDTVKNVRGALTDAVTGARATPAAPAEVQVFAPMAVEPMAAPMYVAPPLPAPMYQQAAPQPMAARGMAVAPPAGPPADPGANAWYKNPLVIGGLAVVAIGGAYLITRPRRSGVGLSGTPRRKKKAVRKTPATTTYHPTPLR